MRLIVPGPARWRHAFFFFFFSTRRPLLLRSIFVGSGFFPPRSFPIDFDPMGPVDGSRDWHEGWGLLARWAFFGGLAKRHCNNSTGVAVRG